ncbi:uncharacterized protein LOC133388606 [Rhineura floridana]|uniref:uncharacterized protein LOC133388606 n=1 Tax=Rhineura floridana TaxID=261503 RepID=UPI002AC818E8|nr:uncharacterized protein LOC133388606 [Rhineura floridana]
MSEERAVSSTDAIEEDINAGGEEHPTRCFQASALCCCIPRRRMYLPGRRPKDRKKKNGKKKTAEDLSLDVTMFEKRQQSMGQDYWSMISVGDLGSVQTEGIKPALTLCTQPYARKTQDLHIPVPLSDIYLEEKQGECDEKTNEKTFQAQQQKEGSDNLSVLSLEREKKRAVGAISEGVPFEEGKGYLVMPAKESRQHGRPEQLSALLQEVAYEKEQQKGDPANIILEGVLCKKDQKDHQDVPFQSRVLKELNSTLNVNEKKLQEEQNTSFDSEGVTSFQELFNQPNIPCSEEQQVLGQQDVMGVNHNVEKQVPWSQMNSLSKGNVQKEDQTYQDNTNQEAQQPVEQKYPDILSTMCGNDEQEQPEVQQLLAFVKETSPNEINLLGEEEQLPIIPKAMGFSFQDTTGEKKQEEGQGIRSSASDFVLSKAEDHKYLLPQGNLQAVATESMTTLPLDVTCPMDLQQLPYINSLPKDVVVHIAEQKHPDVQQLLLFEQTDTHHHSIIDENEQHEGIDCAHFGSQGTAYIEEQDKQVSIASDDISMVPDNISYEKEQQRKLDCGDSGPEGIYDKEDQNHQGTPYMDVQQPLVLAKPSSLPLSGTSEWCLRKDNTNTGNWRHSLDEEPEAQDDQSKMHILVSSKDKEATQGQEEEQSTMCPQAGCNTEGEQLEAWHIQMITSIPHAEQQQRERLNLGATCEEHQKKEKQGLSTITFSSNTREDEGHM